MKTQSKRRSADSANEHESYALPRFMPVSAVARMFGVSDVTLYRAIAAGEFPAVRIRGRLVVPTRAIEAMAEAATSARSVVDVAAWSAEKADQ